LARHPTRNRFDHFWLGGLSIGMPTQPGLLPAASAPEGA
jgi:hypothetical protein